MIKRRADAGSSSRCTASWSSAAAAAAAAPPPAAANAALVLPANATDHDVRAAVQAKLRSYPPAPAGVRAVCTTRNGGVSASPYDSLNLGAHVGDDASAVAHNQLMRSRSRVTRALMIHIVIR